VNAQIETGGGARRRQDATVVDVQDVWINLNRRMTANEFGCAEPMRCRPKSVEDAGSRPAQNAPVQIDATRAPRSAARRIARKTDAGTGRARSLTPGTMTVCRPEPATTAARGTRSATCIDSTSIDSLHTRTSYALRPSFRLASPKDFTCRRQVAEHDAVEGDDRDQMRPCVVWPGCGVNPSIMVFLATGAFCHV